MYTRNQTRVISIGDVKIGDILFEDDLKKRNTNALRWINIDCGSGDLTINFDNTTL